MSASGRPHDAGAAAPAPAAPAPATPEPGRFDPGAERSVLIVLPHPDDETFSSGGTIALLSDAGVPVMYLCATYGDMGRRMGKPPEATRESLRDVRVTELRDACAIIGTDFRYLGLRDKCVEFEDPQEVAATIRDTIRSMRPSTVITFVPGHGVHPDHDAIGQFTVLAVRGLEPGERPRLLGVAVNGANLTLPTVVADITTTSSRKILALKAHRSQTASMFEEWEKNWDVETMTPLPGAPEPDAQTKAWRERLTSRETYYVLDPDAPTLFE